ncbi:MAG: hypothetical protein L0Y57_07515 [Beijerinckiaceae bacterium]|nr:hypothetical protein [Beijerinckiaceae bacterium]
MRFQEALHFRLQLETPGRITFQRLLDNGGERLTAHQHLAMARYALKAIAHRGLKDPIAVLQARPHPVSCLLTILLTLML